jgi:cytochrome c peroxidase
MRGAFIMWSVIASAALPACVDETSFTVEERELLRGLHLEAAPPADPSNRVADLPAAAVLGKKFYFDTRFSGVLGAPNDGVSNGSLGLAGDSGKVACASCHHPDVGGADPRSRPAATSFGAGYTGRNAPTVINAAYSDVAAGGWQFWDGRKDSLWSHALGPPESGVEHNGTRLQFAHIIFDHYRADYEAVFEPLPDLSDLTRFPAEGKPGQPAFDTMAEADKTIVNRIYSSFGKAIAAYERRLISPAFAPSAFDRVMVGDDQAMTASAIRGAKLFVGKAACNECHRGPTFTDYKFHNIGCPQQGQNVPVVDMGRFTGIGSVKSDIFNRAGEFSDDVDDRHLVALDAADVDVGAFKTPTLRNVSRTAPYMHDGVYTDLWDVVNHYNFGGSTGSYSGIKEVTITPLLLDEREMGDLVEFLRSLDDGEPVADPDFPEGLLAAPTLPN